MRRVPRSFQLMGHNISVSVLSEAEWERKTKRYPDMKDAVGYWHPNDYRIFVLRGTHAAQLHVFFHELLHAILDSLNHPLSQDEAAVDNIAGLLAQAMTTAR